MHVQVQEVHRETETRATVCMQKRNYERCTCTFMSPTLGHLLRTYWYCTCNCICSTLALGIVHTYSNLHLYLGCCTFAARHRSKK